MIETAELSAKINELMRATADVKAVDTTLGFVYEADEINNTCYILYSNDKGIWMYGNAKIKLSDNRGESWFPSAGQMVNVDVTGNVAVITGNHMTDFAAFKTQGETPYDIWPSSLNCSLGGTIA